MKKNKTHYRVLRSTVVLARSSAVIDEIRTPELDAVLAEVKSKNYAFDQIDTETLELLYAIFDNTFTSKVRREFVFFPGKGSVRVHAIATGVCELCGKGDSKETGDNRDHLNIEFKLTNTAGGQDTWCGSTCIVNYGLKVDGAATAEEAERLLGMSMRQAVRQFQIDAWRAEHIDHKEIPEQYQALRTHASQASYYAREFFGEMLLLGLDPEKLRRDVHDTVRRLRTSSNFYAREGYLTPKKMNAWMDAKWALDQIERMREAVDSARDNQDGEARFDHFVNLRNKQEKKTNAQAA